MIRGRRFVGLLACAVVLLAQLHAWEARGCPMCGASCRCASHTSSNTCCARAAGCAGSASGDVIGPDGPVRAVLVAAAVVAPPVGFDPARSVPAALPYQPVRDPLDRPPRVSC